MKKTFYICRIYEPNPFLEVLVAQLKDYFSQACVVGVLPGPGTEFPVHLPTEKKGSYYLAEWYWYRVHLDWRVYTPGTTVVVTVDQSAILVSLPTDEGQFINASLGDRLYSLERLASDQMSWVPGNKWFANIVDPPQEAESKKQEELERELHVLQADVEMWEKKYSEQTLLLQGNQTIKDETNSMMYEDRRTQVVECQRILRREKKKTDQKGKKLEGKTIVCERLEQDNRRLQQRIESLSKEGDANKKELLKV